MELAKFMDAIGGVRKLHLFDVSAAKKRILLERMPRLESLEINNADILVKFPEVRSIKAKWVELPSGFLCNKDEVDMTDCT